MRTLWTFVGLGILSLSSVACSSSSSDGDADEDSDFGALEDQSELRSRTLSIPSGGEKAFTFSSTNGGAVTVDVDCGISDNPDVVGNVFSVNAPDLHLPSNETNKAAYFSWSGDVEAGSHTVTLKSVQGAGRCAIKVGKTANNACTAFKAYRSPNINHTHFAVGESTSSDWEPFPASGNHWGAWSQWNKTYEAPVMRGFALHNLEHGGAVLSYKCASAAGADCKAAKDKLEALVESTGLTRYILTPDPEQPTLFAIRTWRMVHVSDCLNETVAKKFLEANMSKGREDIDADPPMPFDPTTTNVPCQNLMAAPDSCY